MILLSNAIFKFLKCVFFSIEVPENHVNSILEYFDSSIFPHSVPAQYVMPNHLKPQVTT